MFKPASSHRYPTPTRNFAEVLQDSYKEIAMRITTKGQVTIPKGVREKAGMLPHTDVEFVVSGQRVFLKKKAGRNPARRADR